MDKLKNLQKRQKMLKQAIHVDTSKLLSSLGGAAATAGITLGLAPAIQRASQNKKREEVWQGIIARNPDLAKDPEDREVFNAIFDTSPKAMSHPAFAVPIIRQAKDYGNYGIPPQTMAMLSRVNLESSKPLDFRLPTTVGQIAGSSVSDIKPKPKVIPNV